MPLLIMTIIQEIYDLFEKLNLDAQIQRVMQLIEMPNDLRPSNYATLYNAKTDIVNWAQGKENGEEYRLTRLKNLKDNIGFVIGNRNLPANLCSKDPFSPEECVKMLRYLDYKPHADCFKDLTKLSNLLEVAFLIQAPNKNVQKWLIERLVHSVPNSINATKYVIDFEQYARGAGVETFWNGFAEPSRTSNSNTFMIDDLAENLARSCHTKNVIIIMKKLYYLNQEIIDDIFIFWHKVVDQLRRISPRRSRLVLLLVAEPKEYQKKFCTPDQKFNFIQLDLEIIEEIRNRNQNTDFTSPQNIFLLSSMDRLSTEDVQEWFQDNEVLSKLQLNDQDINNILDRLIPSWGDIPENVLDSICRCIFKLELGLPAIEQEWEVRSNK